MEKCEMCGEKTREIYLNTIYTKTKKSTIPIEDTNNKEMIIACTKCPFARRKTK